MPTLPQTQPTTLNLPAIPRAATDELYHFLQYLQFKYNLNLETAITRLEDEIDGFDADRALQETGETSLASLKQELGYIC